MTGIIDGISNLFGQASSSELLELAQVRDRFANPRPLFQTRAALGADAEDLLTGKPVILWTLKTTVQPVSQEAAYLVQHFRRVSQLGLRTPRIIGYGVDRRGVAFYATERTNAPPVLEVVQRPKRPAFYMLQIIRILAKLHEAGITLGTICDDTFLLDEDQKVLINGLFPSPGKATPQSNVLVSVSCVAPELFQSSKHTQAADIFSLAAYFYKLLCNRDFPTTLTNQQQYEHLRGAIPAICKDSIGSMDWLNPILEKCFSWKSENRYRSAVELLKAFSEVCPEAAKTSKTTTTKRLDSKAANLLLSKNVHYSALAIVALSAIVLTYRHVPVEKFRTQMPHSRTNSAEKLIKPSAKGTSSLVSAPAGRSEPWSWRSFISRFRQDTTLPKADIKASWVMVNKGQGESPASNRKESYPNDDLSSVREAWSNIRGEEKTPTSGKIGDSYQREAEQLAHAWQSIRAEDNSKSQSHYRSQSTLGTDSSNSSTKGNLPALTTQSQLSASSHSNRDPKTSPNSPQNSKITQQQNLGKTRWWAQQDGALASLIERGSIYPSGMKPRSLKARK